MNKNESLQRLKLKVFSRTDKYLIVQEGKGQYQRRFRMSMESLFTLLFDGGTIRHKTLSVGNWIVRPSTSQSCKLATIRPEL